MKKLYLFTVLLFLAGTSAFSTTHTISAQALGYTFNPDSVQAVVGDTIIFSITTHHFAVEVDDTAWIANHNTSNGGFQTPVGGGMVVVNQARVYYYVCGYHYFMGMKGRIFVSNPAGINTIADANHHFEISPNPSYDKVTIKTNLPAGTENRVRILNAEGQKMVEKENISAVETFDLSKLSAGIYFVAIENKDMELVKRLLILK
jgi:plastocyanin